MDLTVLDWGIIAGFMVISVVIGLVYNDRGQGSSGWYKDRSE